METVLALLAVQGAIGAFDTLYFHEWRARLPALGRQSAPELRLHAARSCLYALIFGTLPWIAWRGGWSVALAAVLAAEIALTLADFVVERTVRRPLGDVYAGERVTHAAMAIVYGAMLANLWPALLVWYAAPTELAVAPVGTAWLRWTLAAMALGVLASGLRDLCAALVLPHSAWPWRAVERASAARHEQGPR